MDTTCMSSDAVVTTFATCGDLVFDEREWFAVLAMLQQGGVEVLPEEPHE